MNRSRQRAAAATLVSLVASGCASADRDRAWVSAQLERRVGHGLSAESSEAVPPDVVLNDGLDEDEAAALALFANPTFLADMARLRTAQAAFEEAARPDNPRLTALAPVGTITAAVSLVAPIMSFFQLPRRKKEAARVLEAVAESLVQSGLDVVRDARVAHINCGLAQQRLLILEALQENSAELSRLASVRVKLGEANPAEALLLRSDAALASDAVAVAQRDRLVASANLRALVGRDPGGTPLDLAHARALPPRSPSRSDLLSVARRARPDVRAAELELEGAGTRVGLERSRVVALSLQSDVQWNAAAAGVRLGGGVELPIFNQNQGGIGRAKAAVEAAVHRLDVVRQRVALEVITAQTMLDQSLQSRARYEAEIIVPLDEAHAAAMQQYEMGEASYLVVLDALSRLGGARLREAELEADARRAYAELERAIGARIEVAAASTGGAS